MKLCCSHSSMGIMMVALVALFMGITMLTPTSIAAYMVPRTRGRIVRGSTPFGPSIITSGGSFSVRSQPTQQPLAPFSSSVVSSRRPAPRRVAAPAMAAAPAATVQKSAAEKMFDFYCSMIWIARPDLFLYDRLARMAWDSLSKNLQKIEAENAPENVVNKALRDMQNDLAKLQKAYNDVTGTQRRMYAQMQQAESAADELYRRAQYALAQGYEESSREALFRRQELLEGAKRLQQDIDDQNETREKLYRAFQTLEEQFREKIAKRDDLMNRAKTAKRMAKINDMLDEFNTKRLSEEAFDNLERKVESMEAQAEASSSFSNWFGFTKDKQQTPMTKDERLEMEFVKLEESAAVDKEIEKMMKDQKSRKFSESTNPSRQQQEEWLDQLLGTRKY